MAIAEQGRPLVRHGRIGPFAETRVDIPADGSIPRVPVGSSVVLPVPPTDKEKYSYVRRHSWILTVCTVLTFPPLVYSQIRLFEDSPWFLLYAPFMAVGTLTFFVSLLADGIGRGFDLAEHRKIVASWLPLWYPSVDVFLPTYGESIELLRNSWTHVAALRAAYNGKLTPYVLDDGARPEVKRMARQFGFAYAVRPNRGWYKKSGQPQVRIRDLGRRLHPAARRGLRPAAGPARRDAALLRAVPRGGDRADAAVLPRRGRADLGRARRRRHPGAVLPVYPGDAGQERRRDLRGQLRGLPPDGARAERRHVAGRALGGPAHRVRPLPAWLAVALPADRAVDRELPG